MLLIVRCSRVIRMFDLVKRPTMQPSSSHEGRDTVSNEGPHSALVEATVFAERLNALYDNWRATNSRRLSNVAVAAALADAGVPVSTPYLSQLRNGARINPSTRVARALAVFFDVDPDYFFVAASGDDSVAHDAALSHRFVAPSLRQLAHAAALLTPSAQQYLVELAERLRVAEGLPAIPADS